MLLFSKKRGIAGKIIGGGGILGGRGVKTMGRLGGRASKTMGMLGGRASKTMELGGGMFGGRAGSLGKMAIQKKAIGNILRKRSSRHAINRFR